jgi:hypothetical protein
MNIKTLLGEHIVVPRFAEPRAVATDVAFGIPGIPLEVCEPPKPRDESANFPPFGQWRLNRVFFS